MFGVRDWVMFRHILCQSRRGKQPKQAIWFRAGKKDTLSFRSLLSFLSHASLLKAIAATLPKRPASPETTAVVRHHCTLFPTKH